MIGNQIDGFTFDPSAGTQILTYTYADGNNCESSDQINITVDELPSAANAGADQLLCSDSFTLAGNEPTIGVGTWTILSGTGSITDPSQHNTTITGVIGTVELEWTISNGTCSSSDVVSLTATSVGTSCDDGDPATTNDTYDSNCMCTGTYFVEVAPTALLDGPYSTSTGLMGDNLRSQGLIPAAHPFNSTPFNHSGPETVAPMLLSVSGQNAIVDWVLVELRDKVVPSVIVAQRAALIQRDGDIVDTDGVSPVRFMNLMSNDYHVAIRHRNHLGVMTAATIELDHLAEIVDFTDVNFPNYGTNPTNAMNAQKVRGDLPQDQVRVMWGGNVVRDNAVRYAGASNDRDPILVAVGGLVPTAVISNAYHQADVTMDALIKYTGSGNDRDPILLNIGGNVIGQRIQQLP